MTYVLVGQHGSGEVALDLVGHKQDAPAILEVTGKRLHASIRQRLAH